VLQIFEYSFLSAFAEFFDRSLADYVWARMTNSTSRLALVDFAMSNDAATLAERVREDPKSDLVKL
jgi:hypothetical protein